MDLNEILSLPAEQAISELKKKNIVVPSWSNLKKEFEQRLHPVKTDKSYVDKVGKNGQIDKMCRITLGWQKLATKRIAEMCYAIPPKRIYKPTNEAEQAVAAIIEDIFRKNRIDSLNIKRGRKLFASCEMLTLWYPQDSPTVYGGIPCSTKLRCKVYSPMDNAQLYPLFDEFDDLVALSIAYYRIEDGVTINYFDTYTANEHIRWRDEGGKFSEDIRESISIGKIPASYIHRDEPIWEDQSTNVYEAEWTLSRNGNYIRKNARPTWVVYMDNDLTSKKSEAVGDNVGRNVLRYPANAKAGYATWQQAIDSIKFHIEEIKRNYFRQLQLPDMSMDEMKSTPMSGEARKMMFIDAQLKVIDESGDLMEFHDRELNVIRAFVKVMYPQYAAAANSLQISYEITPYTINDDAELIKNLTDATGGKQILSQRAAVQRLGWADNVSEELDEIANDNESPLTNLLPQQRSI